MDIDCVIQAVTNVDRYSGITGYKVKNEFVHQFISLKVYDDDSLQQKFHCVIKTQKKLGNI